MAQTRFISYFRVSDQKQGRFGLGLEAQHSAVKWFLQQDNGRLLTSYREVEHGDDAERPQLLKAINDCKLRNAILLVARVDRLSRDIHFLTGLQKAGVQFRAADMPDANELVVHILIAVAQHECSARAADHPLPHEGRSSGCQGSWDASGQSEGE